MNGIKSGASQRVTDLQRQRNSSVGTGPREPVSFSRTTQAPNRPLGPKAVAAALISECSARQVWLHEEEVEHSDFVGHDGNLAVFSNRERSEVCIQDGTDVCTVKSDGRIFVNGEPLQRHQPGFLHMQRTLADLAVKVAAGELARNDDAANAAASNSPWEPASPAHANYIL